MNSQLKRRQSIESQRQHTALRFGHLKILWLLCLSGCLLAAAGNAVSDSRGYLDRVLALVGEDAILYSEFNDRMEDMQRFLSAQRDGSIPPQSVLEREILERMILESLQLQMGKQAGVSISDSELDQTLRSRAAEQGLTLEALHEGLRREGQYTEYRENLRNNMIIEQVQRGNVRRRIRIEDREINRFLKSREGANLYQPRYHLLHAMVALSADADAQAARICLDTIRKQSQSSADFMNLVHRQEDCTVRGNDLGWQSIEEAPTLFEQEIRTLQAGDSTPILRNASGLHIAYVAARSGGQGQFAEQYKVRHILLRDPQHSERVQQKLIEIREQILAGEDFGILAGDYSEDYASAIEGGSLGWVSKGEMTPTFETMMQKTAHGEISPVFASPYGWHILQVSEQRRKDVSEEKIRAQAHEKLYIKRYQEELRSWLDQIRDRAVVEIRW